MVSLGSGDNYNVPCEVMETKFPGLLARQYALRDGTGGAGRHRGGFGIIYDYEMLWPGEFTVAMDRDKIPPYGLFGGQSGTASGLYVNPGTNEEAVYARACGVRVPAGTIISHRTAGGGGYGSPLERDAESVLTDVLDEFITIGEAKETYGVVIDPQTMKVDEAATQRLRRSTG
jgi:N-methylhydantoinase B